MRREIVPYIIKQVIPRGCCRNWEWETEGTYILLCASFFDTRV
jgi:hypothetical protein